MKEQMLRGSLSALRDKSLLLECHREVDPKYEMGAVLKYFSNKAPILFNRIKGSNMTAVGGLFGSRDIYYDMLKVTGKNRIYKFIEAIANPTNGRILKNGPIKENIIKRNIDIEKIFPIPTFHEKDSSSFITAGIVVVKDPQTGNIYTAVRRLQVNGGNKLSILVASPFFTQEYGKMEKLNKPLEVAVVLGYDYQFLLASQISSEIYGVDKYMVDSSLRGEALELVRCETINLEVPAQAEIVLEGVIPPNKRQKEGPFGELMGYYGGAAPHPIIEVTCVLHRNNPIFQVSFPCREEHLPNGLIREVELYSTLKRLVDVEDVNVTIGGGCRFHAVVSINKKSPGDGKSALIGALSSSNDLKHIVVVDKDIDIFNKDDVEGALATRVQGSKDLVVISGAIGSGLDPSNREKGTTDKVGIDATKPLGENGVSFEKARIPGYEKIDINNYFPKLETSKGVIE